MVNEIFKFAKKHRKGFKVVLTTSLLRIVILRQVGNDIFCVESAIPLERLNAILWRKYVADTLRKSRISLRIEICKRYPYRIVAPNYKQALHFAQYTLRLPHSCWHYVNSPDQLRGLEQGTTIHVLNGGPDSATFSYEFWAHVVHRDFKIVQVRME